METSNRIVPDKRDKMFGGLSKSLQFTERVRVCHSSPLSSNLRTTSRVGSSGVTTLWVRRRGETKGSGVPWTEDGCGGGNKPEVKNEGHEVGGDGRTMKR